MKTVNTLSRVNTPSKIFGVSSSEFAATFLFLLFIAVKPLLAVVIVPVQIVILKKIGRETRKGHPSYLSSLLKNPPVSLYDGDNLLKKLSE